jgi:hypothetical protein
MTPAERQIALALARCTFLPGSWQKRFARDMAAMATHAPDHPLSERQTAWLIRLAHTYRRQLPTSVIAAALDEAIENADRRVAVGLPALPPFDKKPREPKKRAQAPPAEGASSLPLFEAERKLDV